MLKHIIYAGVALGIGLSQVQAQNYYKWVDSKGNTTYSSKPPPAGAKQQNIETLRSLGSAPPPQRAYSYKGSNNKNTQQPSYQPQNSASQTYNQPRQPERSTEEEALRQKIIKEASTPYAGAKGLTANQRNTLAAMNGVNVPSSSYSNSNNTYSVPTQNIPSHVTSCDGAGCWDNQGNRYNGNNGTYFNNGRTCRDIGGQLQCN